MESTLRRRSDSDSGCDLCCDSGVVELEDLSGGGTSGRLPGQGWARHSRGITWAVTFSISSMSGPSGLAPIVCNLPALSGEDIALLSRHLAACCSEIA